ncbi:hypothetical protein F5Y15DRAFT_428705 [Xylariaceae sp. FL0016]|nr:hypothetical protein F5Y15DRAFT_428705 [Xylariaceae sp. FL0016]
MTALLLRRPFCASFSAISLPKRLYSSAEAIAAPGWNRDVDISRNIETSADSAGDRWTSLHDETLTPRSLYDLLNNRIPAIRVPRFLSGHECERMIDVISNHKIGAYNENVFPVIGSVGITQFDFQQDKLGYFAAVEKANSLQQRFVNEAGVDIVDRVRGILEKVAGIPVRIATEGDRRYFAGLLRVINSSALIHSDYAPYDAPGWRIGQIVSQITWNVLLKQVRGGESVVYNRFWRGKEDDEGFRRTAPSYGYTTQAVENTQFKVVPAVEGDLSFMNSRNFHEVRPLDRPNEESRYSVSSFVGLLPPSSTGGPELVMWS